MGIVFGEVFYSKVIYTEVECIFSLLVVSEAWCVLYGSIPKGVEFLDEIFLCNYSGFFEAIYSSEDF